MAAAATLLHIEVDHDRLFDQYDPYYQLCLRARIEETGALREQIIREQKAAS